MSCASVYRSWSGSRRSLVEWCSLFCVISVPVAASAAPPNYGHTFATITHAGNAPWVGQPATAAEPVSWGDVGYDYRISTTEVTYSNWLGFVRAAAPFVPANDQGAIGFTGPWIIRSGSSYTVAPVAVHWGVEVAWRYAARYANWLHNGARPAGVATAADFASGAYDTATFTQNPDGSINDQRTRSAGARFWIPSLDEWVKAVYFDPNRYGLGQPGYWQHPGGQDVALLAGYPAQGGQTSATIRFQNLMNYQPDVGSYPGSGGPWGMLDASGGESEWLEDTNGFSRAFKGTSVLSSDFTRDWIGFHNASGIASTYGFRIASSVPLPPGVAFCLGALSICSRRSRSCAPRSS